MSSEREKIIKEAQDALKMLSGPSLNAVIRYFEMAQEDEAIACTKPRERDDTCRAQGGFRAITDVVGMLKGELPFARSEKNRQKQ